MDLTYKGMQLLVMVWKAYQQAQQITSGKEGSMFRMRPRKPVSGPPEVARAKAHFRLRSPTKAIVVAMKRKRRQQQASEGQGSPSAERHQPSQAPPSLPALPLDTVTIVLGQLTHEDRLAVFRSCTALRAVLECMPGPEVHQRWRTRLFMTAFGDQGLQSSASRWPSYLDAPNTKCSRQPQHAGSLMRRQVVTASKALQLAARSAHELQVHICQGITVHQHRCYGQSLLTGVFQPWQDPSVCVPSLRNLTFLWLQGFEIDEPLPDCILQACTALKLYGLMDMTWPLQYTAKSWPVLQELELGGMMYSVPKQLLYLFNTETLPGLTSLRVRARQFGAELIECVLLFNNQLTALVLDSFGSCEGDITSKLFASDPIMPWPVLTRLQLPSALTDQQLEGLLHSAPALRQLQVPDLELQQDHSKSKWKVETFLVSRAEQPSLPMLSRLPHLRSISLKLQPLDTAVAKQGDVGYLRLPLQAAAVQSLKHMQLSSTSVTLPDSSIQLDFSDYELAAGEELLLSHLQTISSALSGKRLVVSDVHVTERLLCALGATKSPCVTFHESCTWVDGVLAFLWTCMPDTNEVRLDAGSWSSRVAHLQTLCLTAERPVTVRMFLRSGERAQPQLQQQWQLVHRMLHGLSNKFITFVDAIL